MDPTSAVAKGGGTGGRNPQRPLVPPFWFTKNTALVTSCNDKTTDNDGKRNTDETG